MLSTDSLRAFVLAVEHGSFSAAARHMGKAQSAVSTAIANLEVDTGVTLFDRSGRLPALTADGRALLPHAEGILKGHEELLARATTLAEDVEGQLSLAIEHGLFQASLMKILWEFAETYPHVSLDVLAGGPNDAADLLRGGRVDLGLMTEQETYPTGFQFRGVGHTVIVPVCGANHPLSMLERVAYRDLRAYRQLVLRSRSTGTVAQIGLNKSPDIWHSDNSDTIAAMVERGFGWAELPLAAVAAQIEAGRLKRLPYAFQQSDDLQGIDVVWTERKGLGVAGQWLRDRFLREPQNAWRGGA